MYAFFPQSCNRFQINETVGKLTKCNSIITIPLLFCNDCALVYLGINFLKKKFQETNIAEKCEKTSMFFSRNLSIKQAVRDFYDMTVSQEKYISILFRRVVMPTVNLFAKSN
jgi:mevalonate pyrophosphate decarboxylase